MNIFLGIGFDVCDQGVQVQTRFEELVEEFTVVEEFPQGALSGFHVESDKFDELNGGVQPGYDCSDSEEGGVFFKRLGNFFQTAHGGFQVVAILGQDREGLICGGFDALQDSI